MKKSLLLVAVATLALGACSSTWSGMKDDAHRVGNKAENKLDKAGDSVERQWDRTKEGTKTRWNKTMDALKAD